MKPVLVIGLGNPLMGDDGVGERVAESLLLRPDLPDDVEVLRGGTDLLRLAGEIEGRRRVVVIDAVQEGEGGDGCRQDHAHHLSATLAVELLRAVTGVPIETVLVPVAGARLGEGVSAALLERLPRIESQVLEAASLLSQK
jgi:hydrogenase maturation protease